MNVIKTTLTKRSSFHRIHVLTRVQFSEARHGAASGPARRKLTQPGQLCQVVIIYSAMAPVADLEELHYHVLWVGAGHVDQHRSSDQVPLGGNTLVILDLEVAGY